MAWDARQLVDLRRKLGWTASDLARRLACDVTMVQKWERDESKPQGESLHQLDYLKYHVENSSEQISQDPVADTLLNDHGLEQITKDQMDDLTN